MQIKTHLAIGIFSTLFFIEHVTHKGVFVLVVLLATLLPAVDSGFKSLVEWKNYSPPAREKKSRSLFHSFTFCILVSLFLAFYFPIVALPFFLGYGLHLFSDAWTIEGIRPFWPLKQVSKGKIKTGGPIEETIFMIFAVLDVLFLVILFI